MAFSVIYMSSLTLFTGLSLIHEHFLAASSEYTEYEQQIKYTHISMYASDDLTRTVKTANQILTNPYSKSQHQQ